MKSLPQSPRPARATRVYFTERTPAVLRLKDGQRVRGKLEIVSLTGGLLSVARPLSTGFKAKLMFLTGSGLVLGSAEMLSPLHWGRQPFRFVALADDDQNKLQGIIQQSIAQGRGDHVRIERLRAW